MNLKKVLSSGVILGMGVLFSTQLFAECNLNERYKMDTVYSTTNNTASTSIENEYKELFFAMLKNYAGIDANALPADAIFSVTITDRASLIASAEKRMIARKEEYENKQLTKEVYLEMQAEDEAVKKETFDKITCTISLPQKDSDRPIKYTGIYNSETKDLMRLSVPMSSKGEQDLVNETEIKIINKNIEDKYATIIQQFPVGGVKNPICITEQYKEANQKGGIPVLIYTDKDNPHARVTIGLDSTGSLNYVYVWKE